MPTGSSDIETPPYYSDTDEYPPFKTYLTAI